MERIKQALERAEAERRKIKPDQVNVKEIQRAVPVTVNAAKAIDIERIRKLDLSAEALRSKRLVSTADTSVSANQYRILRNHVRSLISTKNSSTIGITSAVAGEGKSLTAINLAIALTSEIGSRVLLVDADLRRPSIQQFFGAEPGTGLVDVLSNNASINDAFVDPGIDGLTLLVGGTPNLQASELLKSPNMTTLMELLKGYFTDIVFDLPPVLLTEDAFVFSPLLDGVLLVIAEGETAPEQLKRTTELLKPENLIGSVMNKSRRKRKSVYY